MQLTQHILMIRPAQFRMNEQTVINNYFQISPALPPADVINKAQQEFDNFVDVLMAKGVQVTVVQDTEDPDTPDALFPNNWVSFHADGTVALYPMFAENRRLERREAILELLEEGGFIIDQVMDYTTAEDAGIFLEGTGSLILDRVHNKAYCALSVRSDEELFIEFCEDFEYTPVIFNAYQTVGRQKVAYLSHQCDDVLGRKLCCYLFGQYRQYQRAQGGTGTFKRRRKRNYSYFRGSNASFCGQYVTGLRR